MGLWTNEGKTFKISKTVYALLVIILTVLIPMVVAYRQKKEATGSDAITGDIYQMTVDATDLPILEVADPIRGSNLVVVCK